MSLRVQVQKASNLKNVEVIGKSDPFTLVEFNGESQKTKHVDDELNPTWNETLTFDLKGKPLSSSDEITFTVRDYDKVGTGKFMGRAKVHLGGMISGAKEIKKTLTLTDKKDNPLEVCSDVKLCCV
nr:unnamed protein product [Spirometra erinaceieuropaei]